MALAASLPYMEGIVPAYVAAAIAAFRAFARIEPAAADTNDAADRSFLAVAAVCPLTDMLAGSGPFDLVPVTDWMIAGGTSPTNNSCQGRYDMCYAAFAIRCVQWGSVNEVGACAKEM